MSFQVITDFEKEVAKFFGAPHAVAVDCCTHGLELCLRHKKANNITVPRHTYLSVPMLADKLSLDLIWTDEKWEDFYYVTEDIIDAAVNWEKDSYIPGTYMCVSFQFRKHLSLGRGGIILFDKKEDFDTLKKMSYDGPLIFPFPCNAPWNPISYFTGMSLGLKCFGVAVNQDFTTLLDVLCFPLSK